MDSKGGGKRGSSIGDAVQIGEAQQPKEGSQGMPGGRIPVDAADPAAVPWVEQAAGWDAGTVESGDGAGAQLCADGGDDRFGGVARAERGNGSPAGAGVVLPGQGHFITWLPSVE